MSDKGKQMNEILQAALDFYDAGISVIPAKEDGSKAPITSWKQYQVTMADREKIASWCSGNATGIGVITGVAFSTKRVNSLSTQG